MIEYSPPFVRTVKLHTTTIQLIIIAATPLLTETIVITHQHVTEIAPMRQQPLHAAHILTLGGTVQDVSHIISIRVRPTSRGARD